MDYTVSDFRSTSMQQNLEIFFLILEKGEVWSVVTLKSYDEEERRK